MHPNDFYSRAIPKLFFIVNKEMESIPFVLNPPQKRIMKELGGMDIILKARQQGISSLILALFTLDFLTIENMRCVVVSHEEKATQRLLERVKYFLESLKRTWPQGEMPFTLKYNSRYELVNLDKNSTFYIGTAGARAFGHGETINNLHLSEFSRWPEQERMLIGILQAVPKDGRVIIESTANGFGDHFYKLWAKNENEAQPFHCHFVSWFENPEYIYPLKDDMKPGGPNELIDSHPIYGDELSLLNAYHLKPEQLAWRRWKIDQMAGNLDMFGEQFPATAEEAFIVSGNPVWSPHLMKWYLTQCEDPKRIGNLIGYNPIGFEENEKGYLKIWKSPQEFHNYAIGVDVSEGKVVSEMEGGKERDASCIQVLDKNTYEQIACWHGRVDPDVLGRIVETLARFYNNAFVGVERNSIGLTTIIALRDLNYPNLYYRERMGLSGGDKMTTEIGWITDSRTKELLVNETTNLLRDRRIKIYDEKTIGEMMSYVRDASGHANAAKSAFDDRCVAIMIAIMMLFKQKSVTTGNAIESEDIDNDGGFYKGGNYFNSQGMPTKPETVLDDGLEV